MTVLSGSLLIVILVMAMGGGDRHYIWKGAVNILNILLWTAYKRWSFGLVGVDSFPL
jgi:hypothetical protein